MAKKDKDNRPIGELGELVEKAMAEPLPEPAAQAFVGIDPELDRLRQELADRERQLDKARAELALRDAAIQPLPNTGPGVFEVLWRHSPAPKLWSYNGRPVRTCMVEASNEQDAWSKFVAWAIKLLRTTGSKNPEERELRCRLFNTALAECQLRGFDRQIQRLTDEDIAWRLLTTPQRIQRIREREREQRAEQDRAALAEAIAGKVTAAAV